MFRPIRSTSSVTFVSTADPAIDWDKIVADELDLHPAVRDDASMTDDQRRRAGLIEFHKRYVLESAKHPGAWKDFLKMKSGERPTIYTIGAIPSDTLTRIEDECKAGSEDVHRQELGWQCFLHGLVDLQNFGSSEIPKRKVGDAEYVDPAWIKTAFVMGLRSVAVNVGLVIWRWNQLTEVEVKN